VRTNAEDEVARLKQQDGNDMFIFGSATLFGSANLASTLADKGLVDEYRLGLNPILLGSGNPLFKRMPHRLPLRLLEARPIKTGCVILRSEPEVGA
jgi:dihydrofolate reductase